MLATGTTCFATRQRVLPPLSHNDDLFLSCTVKSSNDLGK